MRTITTIIFMLSLLACSGVTNSKPKVPENGINKDSLKYSQLHTRPDIDDIKELEKILRRADKAEGYNFNGHNGNPANVECSELYNGKNLCGSATNKKILTEKQINALIEITCDTSTYDGKWYGIAGVCYIPHMGFGFFEKDSLIAEVTMCYICSGIRTIPYYKSNGLTTKGGQRFSELAKELGLNIVTSNSRLSY